MQAIERRKCVTISPEVHQKIVALRRGNQTFGDVIAESIQALEDRNNTAALPRFEDVNFDELESEMRDAEKDFDNRFVSLEESMRRRYANRNKTT